MIRRPIQRAHGTAQLLPSAACEHCDRPVAARNLCVRHYQMWHRHGDPLHADKRKKGNLPPGQHLRRGYRITVDAVPANAVAVTAATEKTDRAHRQAFDSQGIRGTGGKRSHRKNWEHRKVAGAKPGEVVHHIDGDPLNNERENLHVFSSPAPHAAAHRSLERCAYELLRCGLVVFDRNEGLYRLADQST